MNQMSSENSVLESKVCTRFLNTDCYQLERVTHIHIFYFDFDSMMVHKQRYFERFPPNYCCQFKSTASQCFSWIGSKMNAFLRCKWYLFKKNIYLEHFHSSVNKTKRNWTICMVKACACMNFKDFNNNGLDTVQWRSVEQKVLNTQTICIQWNVSYVSSLNFTI